MGIKLSSSQMKQHSGQPYPTHWKPSSRNHWWHSSRCGQGNPYKDRKEAIHQCNNNSVLKRNQKRTKFLGQRREAPITFATTNPESNFTKPEKEKVTICNLHNSHPHLCNKVYYVRVINIIPNLTDTAEKSLLGQGFNFTLVARDRTFEQFQCVLRSANITPKLN